MPVQKITNFKGGAVGNVYRCTLIAQTLSGTHNNTFHLRQVVPAFSGDVFDDIKTTWDGAVKASYLALFSNFLSLQAIHIAQVDDSIKGLPSQTLTLTGSGTRSVATDYLPGQNAAVLEFDTGFSGRKGRGRNFIGQLVEGDNNAGNLSSAMQTLMNTYGNTLMTTFVSGSAIGELVIFTKVDNTVAVVTSVQAKPVIYTQRRRRLGVGS